LNVFLIFLFQLVIGVVVGFLLPSRIKKLLADISKINA
jgi:hypothetical protein